VRIVRYVKANDSNPRYGIVENEHVLAATGDIDTGLTPGEIDIPLSEARLLAPVEPTKIVCVGLNYLAHVTENDPTRSVPDEPVIFMKPLSALIGPGDEIRIVNLEHRTDYEAELAVVIGRLADNVSEAGALNYVRGYTCANDVSDRVLQKKDGQWIRAKGFRTYCPVGPWIETDLDLGEAVVQSRLNGELRQQQAVSTLIFNIPFLISYISRIMTLNPGDLLLTGTPEGVGSMTPGDVIEVEVTGIGTLSNPVSKL
jgi:2-keto-4-pentenoate hydratase/2-oxohepta-3-ene-1,7-dioic acid hydratase in catechol pathway